MEVKSGTLGEGQLTLLPLHGPGLSPGSHTLYPVWAPGLGFPPRTLGPWIGRVLPSRALWNSDL